MCSMSDSAIQTTNYLIPLKDQKLKSGTWHNSDPGGWSESCEIHARLLFNKSAISWGISDVHVICQDGYLCVPALIHSSSISELKLKTPVPLCRACLANRYMTTLQLIIQMYFKAVVALNNYPQY